MSATEAPVAPYRPSRTRAISAMVLIGFVSAVLVYSATVEARASGLVERAINGFATDADFASLSREENLASGAYIVGYIGAAIAFLAWLSRAVENIPPLGGGRPMFTPRSAIGWWFVPFANFVQGYRIVADLWRRMATTASERRVVLVLAWWLLWLGAQVASRLVTMAVNNVRTFEEIRALVVPSVVAPLATAVAGLLLIWIIRETERRVALRAALSATAGGVSVLPVGVLNSIRYCASCGAMKIDAGPNCTACGKELPAPA